MTTLSIGKKTETRLNDLFGIFFEDLNHAADGGLYSELVQNRSFEFEKIDNPTYSPTYGWEFSEPSFFQVSDEDCLNTNNRHYLKVDAPAQAKITNTGFYKGMAFQKFAKYDFSFFIKPLIEPIDIKVWLGDKSGNVLSDIQTISVESRQWLKYEASFESFEDTEEGNLNIEFPNGAKLLLDMVSLFPKDTFNHRKNYVRRDIGETLKAMHPKFLRFPGGCLIHDGSLNADDRDSMYRWKNSLGPVESRPTRRKKWNYNQTLGLGYYELFQLSEDLGAEPLPVLPGGYDPHSFEAAPMSELGEWIDDALDLIEFANGSTDTKWGKRRSELGHPKPFNLKYIAIGNEEVGQAFFDRYPHFQKAIRDKYPEIKIIGTAGPFPSGAEFNRGWKSAKENQADIVDEHYYMSTDWFLANQHRYDSYDPNGPKVFLGEYATKGNKWYNAVVEASYMLGLERNANKVALACYAPLFANINDINWKPDLIYYDQKSVYPSMNYYVQKLFMDYQGTRSVEYQLKGLPTGKAVDRGPIKGSFGFDIGFPDDLPDIKYRNLTLKEKNTGKITKFADGNFNQSGPKVIGSTESDDYVLSFDAIKVGGRDDKGFAFRFGNSTSDSGKYYEWVLGGWANQDSIIRQHLSDESESDWNETLWTMNKDQTYHFELKASNRHIVASIDGKVMNDANSAEGIVEPIYSDVTFDDKTKQYYLKVANVTSKSESIQVAAPFQNSKLITLSADPNAENKFDGKNKLNQVSGKISGTSIEIPAYSVSVLISPRIK